MPISHSRACPKKQTAGPPTPVPSNIWGSFQRVAQPENANAAEQPWRATRGSAELNLCSTARLILTPRMGVQLVESDFKGPLPPNTVGLLLGHSSMTFQGLVVHPGVIDSDYTGEVKIMVSSPWGIVAISPGNRIAQLLLLPSCHSKFPANDKERGNRGFGSIGATSIYCSMDLDKRPLLVFAGRGKSYFRIA